MKFKLRILVAAALLCLLVAGSVFAGTTGVSYNVTIPGFSKVQILSSTKTRSSSYDYFCIKLTGGTAESIVGSSNYGGSMKVYKGQGYAKIYYSNVPATGDKVKLYAALTSALTQTASGSSYCN